MLASLSPPPAKRLEDVTATEPAPSAPLPDFIRMVAAGEPVSDARHHEAGAVIYPYRNPRRALERVRSRAAGAGAGGSARAWTAADAAESITGGLAALPELDAQRFTLGTAGLKHRNGAEHNAFFDPAARRVIKLTMPGEFGAWGGLEDYLQRLAWVNELFDDEVLIEGWLRYPNEEHPRLVTSQPWYRVNPERPEPNLTQIDAYMWRTGFLKA